MRASELTEAQTEHSSSWASELSAGHAAGAPYCGILRGNSQKVPSFGS